MKRLSKQNKSYLKFFRQAGFLRQTFLFTPVPLLGPKNYGGYQSKLSLAAKKIYEAGGTIVLKKLWEALKKHQEEMNDEEFANMLNEEVHSSVADVYFKWE